MPSVVSDYVDAYVFRRLNARVQFLLLKRRPNVTLGNTWQAFSAAVEPGETAVDAARRAVTEGTGLGIVNTYSADYINQYYDHLSDRVILAPVLALTVQRAPIVLGEEFGDSAWVEREEATGRLPFTGQRWAVRHIDEIMGMGEEEAELYRVDDDR